MNININFYCALKILHNFISTFLLKYKIPARKLSEFVVGGGHHNRNFVLSLHRSIRFKRNT